MPKTIGQITGVLLAVGLSGAVAPPGVARAQERAGDGDALVAKIDRRVRAWQPTPAERRLDDIAWARDLRDGLRLARDNGRPVFLFTYSGCAERANAIALQRC